MYFLSEDPKHKLLEKIRTWGGYFVFLLTTAIIGTLIIMHYNGYSFNKLGEVKRTGFVTVTSNPVKANVYLDGQKLKGTTYMRLDLPVGSHDLVVRAPGYQEWSRSIVIEPSKIYWLDYIQLYPKNLKSYALQSINKNNFKFVDEIYGKDYYLGTSWQNTNLTFSFINLNDRSDSNIKSYSLNEKSIGLSEGEIITGAKVQEWDSGFNSALIKLKTNQKEYLLLYSIEKPDSIINISKDYGLESEQMHFSYSKQSELFYKDKEQNLRIIDLENKIITKPLLKTGDITSYAVKNRDKVYFIKQNSLFVQNYDKDEPLKIADLPALDDHHIAIHSYDESEYIIDFGMTSSVSRVNVWRLNGDKIVNDYTEQLEGKINNYKLSKSGRSILFSTDNGEVATFIFDDKVGKKFKLEPNSSEIKWGGISQIAYKKEDGFHLIDFTGDNDVLILEPTPYPVIVLGNFQNIFFLKDKTIENGVNTEINLNAIDMYTKD